MAKFVSCSWTLNLNDIGPELGKKPTCIGSSDQIAEFQYRKIAREALQAVLIEAASCNPNSSIDAWRIKNFWILPVTVIGKPSTNLI